MHEPDAIETERTVIVRPRHRRRGFDATTVIVSSVVSAAYLAFAFAVLF